MKLPEIWQQMEQNGKYIKLENKNILLLLKVNKIFGQPNIMPLSPTE